MYVLSNLLGTWQPVLLCKPAASTFDYYFFQMLPLCRGLLDDFEPLNFQLRLWLWAKSLLLVFNSLSIPIMQTRGDQHSSDRRHHLKHSSRTNGLMHTKDRRWGNWKEWESKQEKLSFPSWWLLPADNSGIWLVFRFCLPRNNRSWGTAFGNSVNRWT